MKRQEQLFEEKVAPVIRAKPRTRKEVLERMAREEDRRIAMDVVTKAAAFLKEWQAAKKARFDACVDRERTCDSQQGRVRNIFARRFSRRLVQFAARLL